MPIYEYQCSHCRYYLEIIQKITDAKLRKCPSCGRNTLQKLVSAPVFRLKGSGWYETDFKSDQEKKRNLAGGEAEPAGAESKDSKADSAAKSAAEAKPAAAAPSAPAESRAAKKPKAAARPAPRRAAKPARRPAAGPKRRSRR